MTLHRPYTLKIVTRASRLDGMKQLKEYLQPKLKLLQSDFINFDRDNSKRI